MKKIITRVVALELATIIVMGSLAYIGFKKGKAIGEEKGKEISIHTLGFGGSVAEAHGVIAGNLVSNQSINLLAIGNSITVTPISPIWFGKYGASASRPDKDYVHLLAEAIHHEAQCTVSFTALNYSWWEMLYASDRTTMLPCLDAYLSSNPNYIILELGENVTDTTTLEADFEELIQYIIDWCPNAKIVLVDNFWPNQDIHQMKLRVSEKFNIPFIDLSVLTPVEDFELGLHASVLGDDGKEHTVFSPGVATHPNDKAHQYYADAIFKKLY